MNDVVTIIPAYGNTHLTASVTEQLLDQAESDVLVVDNQGSFDFARDPRLFIHRPGKNLFWVSGCNVGAAVALSRSPYEHLVFLNNDTVLCPNFVSGLLDGFSVPGAGIVAPMYDDVFQHQILEGKPNALDWRAPSAPGAHAVVPFVDGTAFAIPATIWKRAGPLDDDRFGPYGFGADFDLCLRVRALGLSCVVSSRAYLNHYHQATASIVAKELGIDWTTEAGKVMEVAMTAKYGPDWVDRLWGLPEAGR